MQPEEGAEANPNETPSEDKICIDQHRTTTAGAPATHNFYEKQTRIMTLDHMHAIESNMNDQRGGETKPQSVSEVPMQTIESNMCDQRGGKTKPQSGSEGQMQTNEPN